MKIDQQTYNNIIIDILESDKSLEEKVDLALKFASNYKVSENNVREVIIDGIKYNSNIDKSITLK